MHVFSNYTIHFEGAGTENREAAKWLSSELDAAVETGAETAIEEDTTHNHVEDLWDWLEPFSSSHPEAAFSIEGYIDGSSGSGEFEDFKLEVAAGLLTGYRSGWYEETSKDSYEDYADFCEYYENSDGTPICTEEEFDAFEGEFIRLVGVDHIRMFDEVPLDGPITDRNDLPWRGLGRR